MNPCLSWLSAIACVIAVGSVNAADDRGTGKGREETRANATKKGGSTGNAGLDTKPPLQTGEVQVPEGGVDTSRFDPNAGEGFKGRSTSGGGVIVPRGAAGGVTGGTQGAPVSGATGSPGPREAGRPSASRSERRSGTPPADGAGTPRGGGKNRTDAGFR